MILKSLRNQFLLREIKRVLYLEAQLNRTYGSINKPTNHFGQSTKYTVNNADMINTDQKELKKDYKPLESQS